MKNELLARFLMFAFMLLLSAAGASPSQSVKPVNLNIARMAEPVGMDDATPTLRWSINAEGSDVRQGACSIRIASSPDLLPKADVWESGQVKSGRPEMTIPESVRLLSGARYFWQVKVWDEPLAPSVTKLDTRGLCVTHEIGGLLRPGENVIDLACSSGWYVSRRFKVHQKNSPLIRLQATAREGKKLQTLFGSDAEWKGREANRSITGIWGWNNFGGEAVDGRLESSQWKELECPAEGWRPVRVVSAPPIEVSARTCPPNRFGATYKAEKVSMSTPCIRRATITMRA